MATTVGHAQILIGPELNNVLLRRFETTLRAHMTRIERTVRPNIGLELNATAYEARLRSLLARSASQRIDLNVNEAEYRARLRALTSRDAEQKINANLDAAEYRTRLRALTAREHNQEIDAQLTGEVPYRARLQLLTRPINQHVNIEIDRSSLALAAGMLSQVRGRVQQLRSAFVALRPIWLAFGAAIISTIPHIVTLTSSLAQAAGAVVGIMIPAAFGAVGAFAALALGFRGVIDGSKLLTAEAARVHAALNSWKQIGDQLAITFQQRAMPGLENFLNSAKALVPQIDAFFARFGNTVNRVFNDLARHVTSDVFQNQFRRVLEGNNRALDSFGTVAVNAFRGFTSLAAGAVGQLERFAGWLARVSDRMADWLEQREQTGQLAKDFERMGDAAAQWGRIFGNIMRALFHTLRAIQPLTENTVQGLEDITEKWAEWSASDEGQQKILKFFTTLKNIPWATIAKGILAVATAMATINALRSVFSLASVFAPLAGLGPVGIAAGLALGGVAVAAVGLTSAFSTLYTTNEEFRNGINALAGDIGEDLQPVLDELADWWNTDLKPTLIKGFTAAMEALADGIEQIAVAWKDNEKEMAVFLDFLTFLLQLTFAAIIVEINYLTGAFTGMIKVIGFIVRAWEGMKLAWDLVSIALTASWSAFSAFAEVIWSGIAAVISVTWTGIWTGMTAAWELFRVPITAAWNIFLVTAQTIWAGITSAISMTWNLIWTGMTLSWQLFQETITVAWNLFIVTATTVWNLITSAISTVWNLVWTGMTATWTAFHLLITTAWNAFSVFTTTIWTLITTTISTLWTGIWTAMQLAWTVFLTFITAAWNAFLIAATTIWTAISTAITTIWQLMWTTMQTAWNLFLSVITAAWNAFSAFAQTLWTAISTALTTIWQTMWNTMTAAWNAFLALITAAWNTFSAFANTLWTTIRTTLEQIWTLLWNNLRSLWEAFNAFITAAWNAFAQFAQTTFTNISNTVRSIWETLWNTARTLWENFRSAVEASISAFRDNAIRFFREAADGIRATWDRIREFAAAPVRFIINTVWNTGVGGLWNAARKVFTSMPAFPRATAGFASGGIYPGYTPGRDVGIAAVSGGEAIMRPEWTRAVGAERINQWNYMARTGRLQGFADGGIYAGIMKRSFLGAPTPSDVSEYMQNIPEEVAVKIRPEAIGPIMSDDDGPVPGWIPGSGVLNNIASSATRVLREGADKILAALFFHNPVIERAAETLEKSMDNSMSLDGWQRIPRLMSIGVYDHMLALAASFASILSAAGNGGDTGVGSSALLQAMASFVRRFAPGMRVSSGYRPGDSGYHGRQRAIDMVFSDGSQNNNAGNPVRGQAKAATDAITRFHMGNTLELIHDPLGNRAIWNGKFHRMTGGGAGPGTHNDHVHWAFGGTPGMLSGTAINASDAGARAGAAVSGDASAAADFTGGAAAASPFGSLTKAVGLFDKYKASIMLGGQAGLVSGDGNVMQVALRQAKAMGASPKVLLALFMAGFVESGFRNLNYGDRDSVGFLQQRPSAGWGTVAQIMNVAYATRSFVSRAMRIAAGNPSIGAGALAQAVQISAFPGRYEQFRSQAIAALQRLDPSLRFDRGGMLPRGTSIMTNQTKSPEPVLTSRQWAAMYSLASEDSDGRTPIVIENHHYIDGKEIDVRTDARIASHDRELVRVLRTKRKRI